MNVKIPKKADDTKYEAEELKTIDLEVVKAWIKEIDPKAFEEKKKAPAKKAATKKATTTKKTTTKAAATKKTTAAKKK